MQPRPLQSHTNDLSHRLVLAAGLVAATAFALVSIAANLRFGISLASTPFDRAIYGTLSIAADLMKIVLPLAVMILWRKRERIFAIAGAVFWIGAVAFSLSAAIGFAASTRGHTLASSENLIESRKAWEAKIIRIEERLDRLGTPRPANVIEADIASLLRAPGAEGCKVINGPVTREICPEVDRLRRELATSKETTRLEADLVADRQAYSAMPETTSVADPQSAALKRLTGVDEGVIRSSIALLISVLVEFGSALGFTLTILAFARPSHPTRTGTIGNRYRRKESQIAGPVTNKTSKLPFVQTPEDLVTRWALDRLDIVSSGAIQADEAFHDFCDWCHGHNLGPLTPQMFGRRFTKVHASMGGKKVRRRGRAYYLGAALPSKKVEAKPAPSQSNMLRRVSLKAEPTLAWDLACLPRAGCGRAAPRARLTACPSLPAGAHS